MPTVTVRDARREDAHAIAAVWAVATPHRVRSAARAAAWVRRNTPSSHRSWVAEVDGLVVGTSSARLLETAGPEAPGNDSRAVHPRGVTLRGGSRGQVPRRDVLLAVEVLPDHGSRGVGTALLAAAVRAFSDVDHLWAVSAADAVTLSFAVRNGFLPDGENRLSVVHTGEVAPPGPVPAGLRSCTLDTLPDLHLLADAHNAAFADDPTGLVGRVSSATLRTWWDDPDAAPELSYGLLDERGDGGRLVAFSLAEVDRERGAGWCGTTASVPGERGRGLGSWVRRRTVTALHEAGVSQAWTEVDTTNAAMIALDDRIGFRPDGGSVRVMRRVPR